MRTASPARGCAQGDDEIVVTARKGVVLATGGFGHNKDVPRSSSCRSRRRRIRSPATTNLGDGVALGLALGARVAPEKGRGGLWTPVSITRRRDGSEGLYPHLSLDRAKPGLLAVNSAGPPLRQRGVLLSRLRRGDVRAPQDRAVDPGLAGLRRGLHRKIRARRHPSRHARRRAVSSATAIIVQRRHARRAGADGSACRRRRCTTTVARHNRFAETGVDVDFGKGETELNRFNGDPRHGPNPVHRRARHAAVPRRRGVAGRDRGEHRACDRPRRARARRRRAADRRSLCLRQRHGVGHGAAPIRARARRSGPPTVFAYRAVMHARGTELIAPAAAV